MENRYDWKFQEKPDFERLRRVLKREEEPGYVPLMELFADAEIMAAVTGIDYPCDRAVEIFNSAGKVLDGGDTELIELAVGLMDLSIAYSKIMNLDYVTMTPVVPMGKTPARLAATLDDENRARRAWHDEHRGLITTREEFEKFQWPSLDQINIFPVEYAASKMPEGMKVIIMYPGIFEDLKLLMGFETLAYASIDQPDLVEDILERLTEIAVYTVDMAAAHPALGAVFYGEDMGFATGTLMSPKFLRDFVVPRHRRIAEACHRHDRLFLLHSCGHILDIMDDMIETVGIDAKHSFEDKILPVEEWYKKYNGRIGIIGGVDMDLLGRGTEEDVRRRTRQILEACAPGGGYCAGTGNSVANYVKLENYYALVDETRRWNREYA